MTRAALLIFFTLLLGAGLVTCLAASPRAAIPELKILVNDPGLYRLSLWDLRAAGIDLPENRMDNVHLVHRGQELPLEIDQSGGAWLFYAEPLASRYSASDVYWLKVETTPGPRMASARAPVPGESKPAKSFLFRKTFEQDLLYLPNGVDGAHWFWKSLTAPADVATTLHLEGAAEGAAEIAIKLAGETNGTHRASFAFDGQPIGEARWEGQKSYLYSASVPNVQSADHALTISAPGVEGGQDVLLLDSIAVSYSHEFRVDGQLFFSNASPVRLEIPSGAPLRLYDMSNPDAPIHMEGGTITRGPEGAALVFAPPASERRYLAVAAGAENKPAAILPVRTFAMSLRAPDPEVDELIIAPSAFMPSLETLVKYRTAQGLHVRLVDLEQVYDEFSDGVPNPQAIRDLVQFARTYWTAPAPRYVLLVGKGSYDYLDQLKGPNKSLMPVQLLPTPHLGEAASDNWYVATSADDPHPALAIGRIPASEAGEVSTAIEKIKAFEAAPRDAEWRKRAIFVSDNKEPIFDRSSDELIRALPSGIEARRVYLSNTNGDLDAARNNLVSAWSEGALLMTYVGHGSIDTWAMGPLFSAEHVAMLNNDSRLPILLTPTCLDGYFYHPEKDSLAEELLFKPGGGIAAGLVPTGLSMPRAQDELMQALFHELFKTPAPTLGEAVMRAKQALAADNADSLEVLNTFTLLGDPALKWEPPN